MNIAKQLVRARKAEDIRISRNPFTIEAAFYPSKENPNGAKYVDKSATPILRQFKNVRVCHSQRRVLDVQSNDTPVTYLEEYYLITRYDTIVPEEVEFNYNGLRFKTELSEPVYNYGGIVRRRQKLKQIGDASLR